MCFSGRRELKNVQLLVKCRARHCQFLTSCPTCTNAEQQQQQQQRSREIINTEPPPGPSFPPYFSIPFLYSKQGPEQIIFIFVPSHPRQEGNYA